MGGVALARVAFGLTVALGVTAGCGQGDGAGKGPAAAASSAPAASPTVSAAAALEAAVRKLNEQSVSVGFVMSGTKITADVDPASRTAHLNVSSVNSRPAIGVDMIVIDRVTYAKVAGIRGVPTGWLSFDTSALLGTQLDFLPPDDPFKTKGLLSALATVEREGDRGFRGTLDPSKASIPEADSLKDLGPKASAVPFTALVNDKGLLTLLIIEMEAVVPGLGDYRATYTGHGQPVTVEPPVGATKASAEVLARIKA